MRLLVFVAKLQVVTWLAVAAVAAGAAPSPTSAPPLATLLARHAPILVLHPAERFRPVPVEGFLADSDLYRQTAAGWEKVDGPLPVGGAGLRLDQRLCRTIDGLAASSCYAAAEAAHGASPVVYGAALRAGRQIALQYWLWYPFNPYSPTIAPGEVWQVHEGDWESVTVILDATGKPLLAGYSQHSNGQRREWAKVPKEGARPRVFVALGSHANYFAAGKHRFDPRIVEPILIAVIEQKGLEPADTTGRGAVVRPRLVRITATSPAWMAFAGAWGEDAYLRAPPSAPARYGNGPPGPRFREQWRRPVADVLSWPKG